MGSVYVFKMVGTDFFKIGMTRNESVKKRLDCFRVYAPNGVEVISVIKTENPRELEKSLHKKFHAKRMSGEFFMLDQNDIKYLESIQDEYLLNLKNFFWTYVAENGVTINDIKKIFISDYNQQDASEEDFILKFINKELSGNTLTCTEIKNIIFSELNIEINTKNLGVILKRNFNQKMKKIEGSNQRVYFL